MEEKFFFLIAAVVLVMWVLGHTVLLMHKRIASIVLYYIALGLAIGAFIQVFKPDPRQIELATQTALGALMLGLLLSVMMTLARHPRLSLLHLILCVAVVLYAYDRSSALPNLWLPQGGLYPDPRITASFGALAVAILEWLKGPMGDIKAWREAGLYIVITGVLCLWSV